MDIKLLEQLFNGKTGDHQAEFNYLLSDIVLCDSYGLKTLPEIPDYFIDIGANNGYTAIWFNYLYPGSKIIALEPHPKTYERLVVNVKGLPITTINKGLGDGSPLYLQDFGGTSNAYYNTNETGESIETTTLRAVLGELQGSYYLKVDAEGGEKWLLHPDNLHYLLNADYTGIEYHPPDKITRQEALDICFNIQKNHRITKSNWSLNNYGIELSVKEINSESNF